MIFFTKKLKMEKFILMRMMQAVRGQLLIKNKFTMMILVPGKMMEVL